MARAAVARALTAPATTVRPSRFDVALATGADDGEVRRLLRTPMGGDILVSLEREPDNAHQVIVARDRLSGSVAGMASRSVQDAFVNGTRERLGYLGQLRIAEPFRRSRALLDEGFAFCRQLHGAGDARLYLMSVVADNHAARRLLLGTRAPNAPAFAPAGSLSTLIMRRSRRPSPPPRGRIEICRGSEELLPEIAACLLRNGERYQFAPCWTLDELCSHRTPGLAPTDFLVAVQGSRVSGCAAIWDQRRFKRAVVRGYAPRLRRLRPLLNIAATAIGRPRLPDVGHMIQSAYLSHFAVDENDVDTALALVAAARAQAPPDVDYVVMGLGTTDPLLRAIRRQTPHREYRSDLYVAFWADGEGVARSIDTRPVHPEVAIL